MKSATKWFIVITGLVLTISNRAESTQETPKLAIITDAGAAEIGLLVSSFLSKSNAVELVERESISAVTSEIVLRKLISGESFDIELVRADGILLITPLDATIEAPSGLSYRLIDVDTGAIIRANEIPSIDAADVVTIEQIGRAVTEVARALGNLSETSALTISQIRIADSSASIDTYRIARNFETLLSRRLQSVSSRFLVLERHILSELSFERRFVGKASQSL